MTETAQPTARLSTLESLDEVTQEIGIAAEIFNDLAAIIADQEMELMLVREKYKNRIAPRTLAFSECETRLKEWATRNRKTFFATKKTLETPHGSIVFRTGQPTLVTKGRTKVAEVIQKLKDFNLLDYVRTKETLDKEALLKKRGIAIPTSMGDVMLDDLGLRVSQPERFRLIIVQEPKPASEKVQVKS